MVEKEEIFELQQIRNHRPIIQLRGRESMKIREIEKKDDLVIERIIRDCLIEYGGNHEGTAWADPNLCRFSEIYVEEGCKYWVAEDESGKLVGGVGIGKLDGEDTICELQKMYCIPEVRGTGIAHQLLAKALDYATKYYEQCYLETLESMKRAQQFYEYNGFERVDYQIGDTDHFCCDVRYIKKLNP